jgi:polar amino acid transport system substrate-binding protein
MRGSLSVLRCVRGKGSFVRRGILVVPLLFVILGILVTPALSDAEKTGYPSHKKLIVGVVNDPPATVKNERGQWTGFNVDLWRYLAVDMGLDYEFRELTFKGVQEALGEGTIDISIAALYETAARYRLFDFSRTIGTSRLAVAVLEGRDSHPVLSAFKVFLSWGVMKLVICFVAVLFALGFILWRIERRQNPDHFGGRPAKGIGAGAYWISSTLAAGACYDITLKSLPARLIGLVWILLGALAFSAFTASLASSVLSNRQMIETYDMNKLRGLRLGVLRDSVQHGVAKKAGGKYLIFNDERDLLPALKTRKIDGAFISDLTLAYYAGKETESRWRIHPIDFRPLPHAFAFPKGSPLRRPVNLALTRIMEEAQWEALAARYGLDNNLEPEHMALGKRSRFSK